MFLSPHRGEYLVVRKAGHERNEDATWANSETAAGGQAVGASHLKFRAAGHANAIPLTDVGPDHLGAKS